MLSDSYEGVRSCKTLCVYQFVRRAFEYRLKCRIYFRTVWITSNAGQGRCACHHFVPDNRTGFMHCPILQTIIYPSGMGAVFKTARTAEKDFARQCLPLMGGSLCWGVGFTSYTAIMGHVGTDAAAANSIAAVVRDLICCMCNGIGSAAGIMVGNELGAGRLERGKAYGIKLKNISYVIGFISAALVLAVTPLIIRMVVLTDQAGEYLLGMMLVMAVYMIGRCINTVVINGVLDGGGDTLFDMYSLIVCMWLIAIPLALVGAFVLHWPPILVYACTCLDEVGKIPWVMLRFRKYKWVQDLTR